MIINNRVWIKQDAIYQLKKIFKYEKNILTEISVIVMEERIQIRTRN